jgi:hypothetical protein
VAVTNPLAGHPMAAVIVVLLTLLVYHQFTTLVNLYPFNNTRRHTVREKLIECGVNGVLMALPPVGFYLQNVWLMGLGVFFYAVLLVGELVTWWVPYFFGTSAHWERVYDRVFRNTITILPARGRNPVPNLEHMVLHGLTLAAAVVSGLTFYEFVRG